MKPVLCVILTVVFIVAFPCLLKSSERPNIVFVLFDDLGWGQPLCYSGASKLHTPNLDRLAKQGMTFTDAHSAASVCTPTRYGLLTGRYPSRIGQFGVLTTYSKPIIPPTRLTVASLLKQNGYHTACIGKWHLGMNWVDGRPGKEDRLPIGVRMTGGPNDVGFDYFYGFTHARNIGTIIEQDRVIRHVQPVDNQPLMIEQALAYLDGRAKSEGPFFLYFPMCPPHTPVVPAPVYVGKSGAQDVVKNDPMYGDWVYQGDDMLGQIMEALQRHGLFENTLLIAASDNGAADRAYAPLRAAKSSIYEGGHRVPYIARWPGHVEPDSVSHDTICLNDLMATAAEILGVTLPDDAAEDSVSFLPTLLGKDRQSPREGIVHQSPGGDIAIRQGPWKAVFHKNGQRELFDLDTDLSESSDVLASNPEIAERLTALMQDYIDRGRSTPGEVQTNEHSLSLPAAGESPRQGKKKKQQIQATGNQE